ncbi:MAG: hypothetical protein WDN06_08805 [Asticcacaulis sp.]
MKADRAPVEAADHLFLPMIHRAELAGFVRLDLKPSGERYRPDERDVLAWAVHQIGLDLYALKVEAHGTTGANARRTTRLRRQIGAEIRISQAPENGEGGIMTRWWRGIAAIAAGVLLVVVLLWWFAGGFILHRALGRPGWPEMSTTDFRLSHAMRTAWQTPVPAVHPGAFSWRTLAPGYDIAELPVLTAREEIDRIYLVRIDPVRYAFSVHTRPVHPYTVGGWEKALPDAALIVNGSSSSPPAMGRITPLLSEGRLLGPKVYDASAGAFVANDAGAAVVDLRDGSGWPAAFAGARNAMVAYPLLIGSDGQSHVTRPEPLAGQPHLGGAGRRRAHCHRLDPGSLLFA